MTTLLERFIASHPDWEDLIQKEPYYIKIARKDDYLLLHYDQLNSDFNDPMVRECRSIILRAGLDDKVKIVAYPFNKFGNYGESYVDTIDWKTAVVQEKVDGSMIILWWDERGWHVSTSGCVDASDATLPPNRLGLKNYRELFDYTVKLHDYHPELLDKNYTWIFEQVSPHNRVVVPYSAPDLYILGARDIRTLEEKSVDDIDLFSHPKKYPLNSLDACLAVAGTFTYDKEGFVVVDAHWHRNKIKSPAWVAVHGLVGNGNLTIKRLLKLRDDSGEFLTYFPEYKSRFEELEAAIAEYKARIESKSRELESLKRDRKAFAEEALKSPDSGALFKLGFGGMTADQFWDSLTINKQVKILEEEMGNEEGICSDSSSNYADDADDG